MTASTLRSSLAAVIGLAVTIMAAVAPAALVDHRAPVVRAFLETAVALVGTLVALLAFGRFRRSRSLGDLSIVYAVALLASVHTMFGTVPDLISPHSVGNGVSERFEVWGTIVVRAVAAGFLVAAALSRPGGRRGPTRFSHPAFLAPIVAGAGSIVLLGLLAPIGQHGLVGQVGWPLSLSSVLQLLAAGLYFTAYIALSKRAAARSDPFLGWIAAGCVFGGFAAISYALLPTGNPDWLRPGDLLRAAAVATWAMGAVSEIRTYWSNIADSARREARRAVALDLHDGLAQELALLATYTYAPAHARAEPQWHEQLQMTAERALAEARRAISALAAEQAMPFETDLEQTAESISGTGVDVRVAVDAGMGTNAIDPLQRESIVRIVREAVTNAVRHGGASHIDIVFEANGAPALRVFDDGVGFVPAEAADAGHLGLVSMRERAEAIGASLAIVSAPGRGTTVEVRWP